MSIRDHLLSILTDTLYVKLISRSYPDLPVFSNERCGLWYVNPTEREGTCYFKSTDGHFNHWDFSLRRLNLHLLRYHTGFIIVDSTKKGKRFPDSFSKTIPIWCCVLNRTAYKFNSKIRNNMKYWDIDLHTHPICVSQSEKSQIEQLIDVFVDRFCELLSRDKDLLDILLDRFDKPLRPLWICPENSSYPDINSNDLNFTPVICLNPSDSNSQEVGPTATYFSSRGLSYTFNYIIGAGDDHESWSKILSPDIFWKNSDIILENLSENTFEEMLANNQLLLRSANNAHCSTRSISRLATTNIYITGIPPCVRNYCDFENYKFDLIINATDIGIIRPETMSQTFYLQLGIPEGKKGSKKFHEIYPIYLNCISRYLKKNCKILIHCHQGKDRSVGVVMVVLTAFSHLFSFCSDDSCKAKGFWCNNSIDSWINDRKLPKSSKSHFISILNWVKKYRQVASPSRATIKRIHSIFMCDYKVP